LRSEPAAQTCLQVDVAEQDLKALDEKCYQAAVDSFTQAAAAGPKDYSLHFTSRWPSV